MTLLSGIRDPPVISAIITLPPLQQYGYTTIALALLFPFHSIWATSARSSLLNCHYCLRPNAADELV
eukprot:scaffold209438_cov25-Prasinocladus_malaysianus.AAC.1